MPSRRVKSIAINERISEAQKGRTRLACRVCRSRRIKCDGQKGTCGRCKLDKRSDCSYENVGSAERMAGRQRKRLLRKEHASDESLSASTEIGQLEWTSPVLTQTQSTLLNSPEQTRQLISNGYAHNRHFLTPTSKKELVANTESSRQKRSSVKLTPVSPLSSSNRGGGGGGDEAYQTSYLTSVPSSSSDAGGANGSMSMANNYPATSWVNMSPNLATTHQQHQSSNQTQQPPTHNGHSIYSSSGQSPHYQVDSEADSGSIDSLWRVYDWQYRCNSGMPPQYLSQTAGGVPTFTP